MCATSRAYPGVMPQSNGPRHRGILLSSNTSRTRMYAHHPINPTAGLIVALLASLGARNLGAQNPLRSQYDAIELRFSTSQPVLHYTLRVDSADLSAFGVELRIRNAPDT